MRSTAATIVMAIALVVVGIAIAAGAIYVGDTDDAPGASLVGILLMLGAFALAARMVWRRQRQ